MNSDAVYNFIEAVCFYGFGFVVLLCLSSYAQEILKRKYGRPFRAKMADRLAKMDRGR